ncbi:Division abnormally delayed protein [Pseudolycoriella hygida]|uniref:Division abnormally delayed protein n=1 Tax=Pseudolycoriella hygida TaxID=35572 RepID=A0A9Q0S019_9DIPT|nr:Division abnormally delayed protein [Pseudolycoriella hygida]
MFLQTILDHIVELTIQSENKTLNLFSQVYRRMSPLSRQPIVQFYSEIRNFLSSHPDVNMEAAVMHFFRELFPVAYLHAVNSGSDNIKGDFHDDYKNCLMHTFEDLQPFGNTPNVVVSNLVQSVGAATVFMTALDRGADILASAEEVDSDYLTIKCRNHLTKMHYCAGCNGMSKHKVKTCYGYCTNVMRGCLAQYVGVLDNPWSNVAEFIESLYHNSVKTDKGVEEVIRTLDVKLSEAIMHAMENGPELEKKVGADIFLTKNFCYFEWLRQQ